MLLIAALVTIVAFFVDEPLRRAMERELNRRLVGYTVSVKKLDFHPIGFRDVKVYDPGHDRHKPVLKKLYERVVQGTSKLLENGPRDEVATRVDISGRLEQPDAGTLAAVLRLVQNAFFRAILPGFDHEVQRSSRS